jgi:signal transduction histidine kinase
MSLRSRLVIGLVTIAIILVCPLLFAIQSLYGLHGDAVALSNGDFAASLLLGRLREGLNDVRRVELSLLFATNEKRVTAREALEREVNRAASLADSLSHFDLSRYGADVSESVLRIAQVAQPEYQAAIRNDTTAADSLSSHVFVPALDRADSTVILAEHELWTRTQQRIAGQEVAIRKAELVSIVALILAVIIAALVAAWLTRSISEPIDDLKSGMSAVADGDLKVSLRSPSTRTDEFGELAQSFREMTQQLNELDKLKAEFVSVASHELKTPLNVMIGYLQLLEEGVYGPLTEKQQEVNRTIAAQANTLIRLVKQLLDVSRFEAGGGRIEPREMNVRQMLTELEHAFHVLAMQREVQFCVKVANDIVDVVSWDSDRINEVLGNLLSNAFKFTPLGGTVELSVSSHERGVLMRVCDTGAGIPAEQLPHIFEKFYQADNQGAAHVSGTGLGLAIAKQIVEAHGGTISCDSTLGVGTTFTIILPVRVTRRSSLQRALPGAAA